MKKILPFVLVLFSFISKAQIVNIPDVAFKNALVGSTQPAIDANNDGEIEVSEAAAVNTLNLNISNIYDLTGIQAFTNLSELNCGWNHLASLDVSGLPLNKLFCPNNNLITINITGCTNLTSINCGSNQLAAIDVSGLSNLTYLECSANQLNALDVSSNTALVELGCSQNHLSVLDLSTCTNLQHLYCDNNQLTSLDLSQTQVNLLRCMSNQLTYLNVKNNLLFNYRSDFEYFNCSGNPNLQYVCADEGEILFLLNNFITNNILNAQVDANCSFSTSGGYSTINGVAKVDADNNGCSSADLGKADLSLKLVTDNDTTQNFYTKTNATGDFILYTYGGNYSVVPQFQSAYYTISPDTLHFTAVPNTSQNLNFCISPNGIHNDLDIKIDYVFAWFGAGGCNTRITYKNKGTETISGVAQLNFQDDKLDFVSSDIPADNQSMGSLSWNFSNLLPFETRIIDNISFDVLDPPINNFGDTLTFIANVSSSPVADETPQDNIFTFKAAIGPNLLPIKLEYFKGNSNDGKNYLNWKADCINTNIIFEIERSIDGSKYSSIGNINAGQSLCQQPFDFTDNTPLPGINYYRIKMKDDAGKIVYSNVIALLNKKTGFEIISMSPNPVTSESSVLNITSAQAQKINLRIIDIMGRTVYSTLKTIPAGSAQIEMNLNTLSKGIYNVSIYTSEGERKVLRFIKQ